MKLLRDLVGETLSDRYRLVARLAGGGMGEVYRAHDLLLERAVAVKVLQPSLARDPELVERFKAEARAAARLSHTNVVAVFDWGCEDAETYYMVMEYVSGSDLRDLLFARSVLEPAQATEIMICVCDALAAAHESNLVHRDIKPENVLISRDGVVKVADFGIAVVADADRTSPGGSIPGTLRYLSPEQAQGREAGRASDIWAAGAVLSELVTGRPPLQGAGAELLRRRASEPPPAPSSFDASISSELDEIVLKACALDPLDRFADASDMASALRRVQVRSLPDAPPVASLLNEVTGEIRLPEMEPTEHGPQPRRNRKRRRRRRLGRRVGKGLVALLLVSLLGFGGYRGASAFFAPRMVRVPDFIGLGKATARDRAESRNLFVRVAEKRRSLDAPRGRVISQSPAGGRVQEESRVDLVVSAGPPLIEVPAITGMEVPAASVRLRAARLVPGEIIKRYSPRPAGVVIGRFPAGARTEAGDKVKLVVSLGLRPVAVPTVAGLPPARATKKLEAAGFEVQVSKIYSDAIEEGTIMSVSPAEGSQIPVGDTVEVAVSLGPEFADVVMPDVRGLLVDQAKAKLSSLGLRVDVVDSCNAGTTVVETDPIAGSTTKENERVGLFLC